MKPTVLLAEATTPAGDHLELYSHDESYFLKANGAQLMTSFLHGSEVELARLGCEPIRLATQPHVLIGGLGLGYTLAEACRSLPQKGARFTVAEAVTEMVTWNKAHLSHLHPGLWEDPRVEYHFGDIGKLIGKSTEAFNAILLNMDDGLEAFVGQNNDALYTQEGLTSLVAALKLGGLLAIWSSKEDKTFEKRLRLAGFDVSRVEVPAASRGKQRRRHTIWLARNGEYEPKRRPQQP
jgi:spermidine synthase